MTENDQSLGSLFAEYEKNRAKLARLPSANAPEYQDTVQSAISELVQALKTADQIALFSPNESLDDVTNNDIRYFLLHFHLATLYTKRSGGDRKRDLELSQQHFTAFLRLLDSYDILGKENFKMLERYQESPNTFSIVSSTDPATRRDTKIRRFKEEKEMKQRLDFLRSKTSATSDDELIRNLYLQQISLSVHETWQSLESVAQEMHILSLAPPPQSQSAENASAPDSRDRARQSDGYTDRLDGPLSAGLKGPLLDSKGRPMRPFTLLDKRQQFQQGVFRPDHSLPTMTIDEYLEEEKRRGGIIEGGGPQSGMSPEPDEDNWEKADAETMKARAWDDFKDDNPKGAGNTLNRG